MMSARTGEAKQTRPEVGGRTISPRRALPGGRAVLGGLLVAVAAIGTFVSVTGAGAAPTEQFVVVARDIPRGATVSRADLTRVAVDLPPSMADRAYRRTEELEGLTTTSPLSAGDLIQRTDVLPADEAEPLYQLSFALDANAALNGTLRRGDTVDVLATYGSSTTSQTRVIARGAVVLDVPTAAGSGTLGDAREVALTAGVHDAQTVLDLSNALSEAALRLVRTTGVDTAGQVPPDLSTDVDLLVPGATGRQVPAGGDPSAEHGQIDTGPAAGTAEVGG